MTSNKKQKNKTVKLSRVQMNFFVYQPMASECSKCTSHSIDYHLFFGLMSEVNLQTISIFYQHLAGADFGPCKGP